MDKNSTLDELAPEEIPQLTEIMRLNLTATETLEETHRLLEGYPRDYILLGWHQLSKAEQQRLTPLFLEAKRA